jgi:hypothetical protein
LSRDTFAAVAKKCWASCKAARSDSHTVCVWRRLEADVFPAIAWRSLQTGSQVFRYAIAHGIARRNPAVSIRPSDVLASRKKQDYARVDGKELPQLLRKIEVFNGSTIARAATKLMAMTFVRTGEAESCNCTPSLNF